MELYARINGNNYPISYGSGFDDQLNETLDSGTIILPHINEEIVMKPYDDIWIYSSGFPITTKKRFKDLESYTYAKNNGYYYHHFLIGNFSREKSYLDGSYYTYNISLVSESKKLETCVMPNRTITQPKTISANSRSLISVIQEFVNSYGHQVRVKNGSVWEWQNEFVLDSVLNTKFAGVMAPEMSFNNPTLRQALQQLFLVKDCLPILKDGVITYLDISERTQSFTSIPGASWEQYTMDMSSYSDRLRRTYNNALSQNNTTRFIEKMGFRNSDASTMTLENMRIEFTHPIYKIKSIKLCLYNKYNINDGTNKVMLSRYDITPLVLQNSVRNLLSEDWNELKEASGSFERMSKFKICTVGYDIGSKYITGWGNKYTYPVGWWSNTKCYFENILETIFKNNTLICGENVLVEQTETGLIQTPIGSVDSMISPASNPSWLGQFDVFDLVSDFTQKIKTVFFEVEYDGFIDGAVQIVKDLHDGNITTNDATASSLTIVEKDGLFEKEKANRLGNSVKVISARVNSLTDILPLGSYNSGDEIIYKVTTNIAKDFINVSYYLCKDYVLKNYYTAVWAKQRPFALASYGESVLRDENRYRCLLLSKDKCYYENSSTQYNGAEIDKIVSFFGETNYDGLHQFNNNEINSSLVNSYLVDTQCFTVGNSLCFTVPMIDNITAGSYIKTIKPTFSSYFKTLLSHITKNNDGTYNSGYEGSQVATGDLTGSVQDWNWISNDKETGYATNVLFKAVSYDTTAVNSHFKDEPNVQYTYDQSDFYSVDNDGKVTSGIYKDLFDMSKAKSFTENNSLYTTIPYKDGKERINTTFQIDAISDSDDIKISDRFLGMSNLNPNARKFNQSKTPKTAFMLSKSFALSVQELQATISFYENIYSIYIPDSSELNNLVGVNLNITKKLRGSHYYLRGTSWETATITGTITFGNVISANDYEIVVSTTVVMNSNKATYSTTRTYNATFKVAPDEVVFEGYDPANLDMQTAVPVSVNGYTKYSFSTNKELLPVWHGTSTEFESKITIVEHQQSVPFFTQALQSDEDYTAIETNGNMNIMRDNINFSGYATTKNIYWYICNKLPKYYVDESVPTGATEITPTVSVNTSDKPYLSITLPQMAGANKSVRCYIDGKFVFGLNTDSSHLSYQVYLSLMDSRSLSVLDNNTGEVVGHITNYLRQGAPEYGEQNDYD